MSLQSALRELRILLSSGRLWLVFLAVVALFAVTGPLGTLETLRLLPRFGYWLAIHAVTWSTALICVVAGDMFLSAVWQSRLGRMLAGSAVGALPMGAAIVLVDFAAFGERPEWDHFVANAAVSLPLSLIFCLISYLALGDAMTGPRPEEALRGASTLSATHPTLPSGPALLARLKRENRGELLHVSVEDHYSLVTTSKGRELILLRFADAIRETAPQPGMQVHRSHWVADSHVERLSKDSGKLELVLRDGTRIPVSRTYAAEVRARFH